MKTPRINGLSARSPHATTALALALSLAAALACDENAPTETRAPSVSTSTGATGDETAYDFSTMAIPLPVNQSVATTAPAPAFRVNQTGTGPNGIFQITRAANTQPALQGLTNGRGRAGFFQINNSLNTQATLHAQTNGSGGAMVGQATGSRGSAGVFQIINTNNPEAALFVSTNGRGPTIVANNFSRTPAGHFEVFNATNGARVLEAMGNHQGGVFAAFQSGIGEGGSFQITNSSNAGAALHAETQGTGLGLWVSRGSSLFNGNVTVTGTLTKGGGSFRIDHPLDPERKYLSHSFVESPDMMNVYNGNVTLDENGRATVELPEYFEALNRDFRYQLTPVGAPGPNLYIAEGVKQNRFKIAGGRPYAHVSWQVTGVRQDPFANAHRIKVEEEKPLGERELVARR